MSSDTLLRGDDIVDPETVTFEHNRAEVPSFVEIVEVKANNGDLIKRAIIQEEQQDGVLEHPVLTSNMGSGKTRETQGEVSRTINLGVNVTNVPRRKLAVNQQRSHSATYGRCVFDGRISSLLSEDETHALNRRIAALDVKVNGAARCGNMDIAQREQLLARLGHGYVVYSKADKHIG